MRELSIIIVNYNVKEYIEKALLSIYEASRGIDSEIFVVDNDSSDGSCEMIKDCLLYTSPSPRDLSTSRMPSSA